MTMKSYLASFTAITATILVAQAATAEEYFEGMPLDISANVAWTSNYLFRGVSQTDEKPAAQLGLNATYSVAENVDLYAGAWGSHVDFNDGNEASYEVDYLSGVAFSLGEFDFDLGTIYYSYPGARDSLNYDFFEYVASVGHDFGGLYATYSLNYSPDNFGNSGDAYYNKLAGEFSFYPGLTFSGYGAHQSVEDNAAFGVDDYFEYGFGATYAIENFADVSLNFVSTDLSEADCGDNCGNTLVFSVAKSF